jgi:hypothetical protein
MLNMLNIKNYRKDNLFIFYSIWGFCIWLMGTLILSSKIVSKYWINLIGITLLILLIFINIMAFIIVHIYPKYLYFPINNHYAKCSELYLIDITTHHFPLIIHLILLYYGIWKFDLDLLLNGLIINVCIFMTYLFLYNPFKVYIKSNQIEKIKV